METASGVKEQEITLIKLTKLIEQSTGGEMSVAYFPGRKCIREEDKCPRTVL